MIKKNQFKGFSFWGFKDQYEFQDKSENKNARTIISKFYSSRKSKQVNNDNLTFVRGNKFWTWFNFWSELWPYQTISVQIIGESILVTYKIHGGTWIRFPPYQLEKEIIELEKTINAT